MYFLSLSLFEPNIEKLKAKHDIQGLTLALKNRKATVRCDAAAALGSLGNADAVDSLIACLQDSDNHVRTASLNALSRIGDSRGISAMISLLREADDTFCSEIIHRLIELEKSALELLINALNDSDGNIRKGVLRCLGMIEDNRAIKPLSMALLDPDWAVRSEAADALVRKGPGIIEELVALLKTSIGEDKWGRDAFERIVGILVRIGDPIVPALMRYLHDKNIDLQLAIIITLGKLKNPENTDCLLEALQNEESIIRDNAVVALGNIGSQSIIGPLEKMLNDPEVEVRKKIAISLGFTKHIDAVRPLVKLLEDCDKGVKEKVVDALWNIGIPAVDPMIALFEDRMPEVQEYMAAAMGKIGDHRAVEPLIRALMQGVDTSLGLSMLREAAINPLIGLLDDRKASSNAIAALAMIGDIAVPPLLNLFTSSNGQIREKALQVLILIDEPSIEALSTLLDSDDSDVLTLSIWALGCIGGREAAEVLIPLLGHRELTVRAITIKALVAMWAAAEDSLEEALSDSQKIVRLGAIEALSELGDEDSLDHLQNLLSSKKCDQNEKAIISSAIDSISKHIEDDIDIRLRIDKARSDLDVLRYSLVPSP